MDTGNKIILFSVILLVYAFISSISYIEYKINYDNEKNGERVNLKLLYILPWCFASLGGIIAQIVLKYNKKYLILNNILALILHIVLMVIYIILVWKLIDFKSFSFFIFILVKKPLIRPLFLL